MSLPLIVVVGSTGLQGSSVVKTLASTNKYQIRALTRDPHKASEKLSLRNVTYVEFDFHKPDTYIEAFKGEVYAVFAMTNFTDPAVLANPKLEIELGNRLVDAAVSNNVKYFIWSTLPSSNEISNGKYKVTHMDNKAEVTSYARSRQSLKSIFVHVPFYLQNFFYVLHDAPEGRFVQWPMPATRTIDYIDITDLGKVVAAVLEAPEQHVNRDILVSAGQASGNDFAAAFTKVTGKQTIYRQISREEYLALLANLPKALSESMDQMMQYYSEYGYHGDRFDSSFARNQLKVEFSSLDDWIANSKFMQN